MNNLITFTDVLNISEEYKIVTANKCIPEWYKTLESYVGGEKKPNGEGQTTGTVKRCMPVFDAISAGYLILLPADVYVSQREDEKGDKRPYYEWSNHGLIQFHAVEQAPNHPNRNNHAVYPKFLNPWSIKTPKGYSTLFVQPFHRESVFTILPGIVDTDNYYSPVNFPFVLNDVTFEGMIPAGTPIAQAIPIKRDSWEMSFGTQEDLVEQGKINIKLRSKFFDSYKTLFRESKEYK